MHPKETRYRAVVHYNHFLRSLRRVAAHYGVSKSSLQRWVRATGHEVRTGRSKKALRDSVRRCIDATIAENPFTTARELASVLRTECGLRMSRSTANRLTRSAGFTYKKAFRAVLPKRDPRQVLDFCEDYQRAECIVCIDEAGFYVGDRPRRGYALRGKRLVVEASRTLRRVKFTLMMAVSPQGVVHYEILDHNCKKADFVEFVNRLNVSKGASLLMDNVAFHRSRETLSAIESIGCRPLFIPPYSPRFNAIENVFGVAKTRYRAACPTRGQDAFDYSEALERVLRGLGSLDAFFERVSRLVRDVLATDGRSFLGID